MTTVLSVVLGLGCIIIVHELGHFLVAKLVGLPVERFSIGFPPTLARVHMGETDYCLGAIPLGGYVKVRLGTDGGKVPDTPWYLRMLVVAAGPLANLLLAGVLFILILGIVGQQQPMLPSVVGDSANLIGLAPGDTILRVNGVEVGDYSRTALEMSRSGGSGVLLVGSAEGTRFEVPFDLSPAELPGFEPFQEPIVGEAPIGMPAFEAGVRQGDRIVELDGEPIDSWSQFRTRVQSGGGEAITIAVERQGEILDLIMEPMMIEDQWRVGIVVETETIRVTVSPFFRAVTYGLEAALRGVGIFYQSLAMLFERPAEVVQMSGGPVFVAETLGQQAGLGLGRFLETVAVISIAIMGFNLLPLPILDGGHLIFLLYEGIAGRPLSRKKIQIAQQAGFFLILGIILLVMWRDFSRLIARF